MKTFDKYTQAARFCESHGIDKRLIVKISGQFLIRII